MTSGYYETKGEQGGGGFIVFLLLLLVALAVAVGVLTLPLTQHAEEKHASDSWSAERIRDYIGNGNCVPKQYACIEEDFDVVYCQLSPKKTIGLVIGRSVRQIVTGFMASKQYWENRCSH